MRKLLIGLSLLALVIGGVLFVLASGTGPQHANAQPVTIELEDGFEK